MRFSTAVDQVRAELQGLRRSVPADAPAELGAFLNLHLMMLDDATLSHVPRALIRSLRCNAEWALAQQMDYLVAQFDKIDDPYLREKGRRDAGGGAPAQGDAGETGARLRAATRGAPDRGGA